VQFENWLHMLLAGITVHTRHFSFGVRKTDRFFMVSVAALQGVVRRKLRRVKSATNWQLFLYCLNAEIYLFNLMEHYPSNLVRQISGIYVNM
jgi:hypothetical protein